ENMYLLVGSTIGPFADRKISGRNNNATGEVYRLRPPLHQRMGCLSRKTLETVFTLAAYERVGRKQIGFISSFL
ncbi:MAG: hypothetical protein AB7J40_02950, partial [Candidatus Altimarinota bacterium]